MPDSAVAVSKGALRALVGWVKTTMWLAILAECMDEQWLTLLTCFFEG
jgi:hypothetical protein